MTALGIEMTDREPTKGWADIKSTHHRDPLMDWSDKAWKVSQLMYDKGYETDDISKMQEIAKRLHDYCRNGDECTCTIRHDTCPICRDIATVMYWEENI